MSHSLHPYIFGAAALFVFNTATANDTSSSIEPRKIFSEKLITVNEGNGKSFIHSPHVKVFNADGNLVAQGLPASFGDLTSDAKVTSFLGMSQHAWSVTQEAKALGIKLPAKGHLLVVVYAIQPCPPCEGLVSPLVARLKSYSKGNLQVHRVAIES
ncbi:MAG: hypothetical protein ING21_10200 [Burkholderiales bacterium]|jgi:hypothetical protein|nr:hypothetical protein [Burkholderiales bacterium]